MTVNGEGRADSINASIRRGWGVPFGKVKSVLDDGSGAAAVEDDRGVGGGDGCNSGGLVGHKVGEVSHVSLSIGERGRGEGVEVID